MTVAWLMHGVVRAGTPAPAGAPAHGRIEAAGLVALLGRVGPDTLDGEAALQDSVIRHDRLLAAYAAATDVLPLRFGTMLPCRSEALRLLEERAAGFGAGLAGLAGRQEFAVAVAERRTARGAASAASSGAAFLRGRIAERHAALARAAAVGDVVARIRDSVARMPGCLVEAPRPRRSRPPDGLYTLVIPALVPRGSVACLCVRLAAIKEEATALGLGLTLTGPWPPYSFAAAAAEAA